MCLLRCLDKLTDLKGTNHVGFIMSKSKLTPIPEQTVPRLELCAVVLPVELAELISPESDIKLDDTKFYSNGKVVLGYINNKTRRFYFYVSNRILRMRGNFHPEQ